MHRFDDRVDSWRGLGGGDVIGPWDGRGGALDPETEDPEYWSRFGRRTTELAQAELERRRCSEETISAVMSSWSRTIVPASLAVAALAGLLIFSDGAPEPETRGPVGTGLQGLVESALDDDPIPALLGSDGAPIAVTMSDEGF